MAMISAGRWQFVKQHRNRRVIAFGQSLDINATAFLLGQMRAGGECLFKWFRVVARPGQTGPPATNFIIHEQQGIAVAVGMVGKSFAVVRRIDAKRNARTLNAMGLLPKRFVKDQRVRSNVTDNHTSHDCAQHTGEAEKFVTGWTHMSDPSNDHDGFQHNSA
jgi:hypothetical protein